MTKQYDTTRPCIDTSGNFHVLTDIYDLHDYEQDADVFAEHYQDFAQGGKLLDNHPSRQKPVFGIPVFISEYGGIKWNVDQKNKENTWGYGDSPKTLEQYLERYQRLTEYSLFIFFNCRFSAVNLSDYFHIKFWNPIISI